MDSLAELWEFLVDRAGRVVSMSPPQGATEADMELGARATEVFPRLLDGPTERIVTQDAPTVRLMPAWFGGTE